MNQAGRPSSRSRLVCLAAASRRHWLGAPRSGARSGVSAASRVRSVLHHIAHLHGGCGRLYTQVFDLDWCSVAGRADATLRVGRQMLWAVASASSAPVSSPAFAARRRASCFFTSKGRDDAGLVAGRRRGAVSGCRDGATMLPRGRGCSPTAVLVLVFRGLRAGPHRDSSRRGRSNPAYVSASAHSGAPGARASCRDRYRGMLDAW